MFALLGLNDKFISNHALWKKEKVVVQLHNIPSGVTTATLLVYIQTSCLVSDRHAKKCIGDIILTATRF